MASLVRSALAGPNVFPQMRGFICASWGVFNGVEGNEIRDPDVKDLFGRMARSEFAGFVDPKEAGVMKGSNASLVVLDPKGELVHVFNDRLAFGKDFQTAWERLKMTPAQFPAKTAYTFPGVKETAASRGPGGGDSSRLVQKAGPAFRLFLNPGDSSKVVVESRAVSVAQKAALAWSAEPKDVDAAIFKNLLDTINPGGVARAADVVLPWSEIAGTLAYRPAGAEGAFRFAVLSGPIRMSKKSGAFRAEGTFQLAVSYPQDSPEMSAVRGALAVTYVGGGTATADRPLRFTIALTLTPEPADLPPAFRIPIGQE